MMSSFLSKTNSFISHEAKLCDFKTYVMFRNGLYKTCGRGKAIELLKEGWHDRTKYKPNQEVLTNVILCSELEAKGRQLDPWSTRQASKNNHPSERQHETVCGGSDAGSEREEPRHEQHQPNACNESRARRSSETVRTGQAHGEVKKRGRPKKVA